MKNAAMFLVVIFSVILFDQGVCLFYVKSTGSAADCPSGDSPCHSLQYYANHSSFTNNSRFFFLEGEHHLDSVVEVRNVANLSLVGANSGVKILCQSLPSGFHIEEFVKLHIENVTVSNCKEFYNASLHLETGSEVSLYQVAISSTLHRDVMGLVAINVVGTFSISDSSFLAIGGLVIQYKICNRPSHFEFTGNEVRENRGLKLAIDCWHVKIHIDRCLFKADDSHDGGMLVISSSPSTYLLVINSLFMADCVLEYSQMSNPDYLFTKSKRHIEDSTNPRNCVEYNTRSEYDPVPVKNADIIFQDTIFSGTGSLYTYFKTFNLALLRNVSFVAHNCAQTEKRIRHIGGEIAFANCTFKDNCDSAVTASFSTLTFDGNNVFRNNSAVIGGGIRLRSPSSLFLMPDSHLLFENNHADYAGGAIYSDSLPQGGCFYNTYHSGTARADFIGNTANYAGASLYRGIGTECTNFDKIFNVTNTDADTSAIASDPFEVCICEDDDIWPNCSRGKKFYITRAFPGQNIPIRLAAVGINYGDFGPKRVGIVPGVVRAYSISANTTLGPYQVSQVIDKPHCKVVSYSISVKDSGKVATFKLAPEENFVGVAGTVHSLNSFSVIVQLRDCPAGFVLSNVTGQCACSSHISECDINNQSVLRPADSWIGFVNVSNEVIVVFHYYCPFGYCVPHDVNITLSTSDSQCESHRTGLLCGKCEEGYSLTLGDGKCAKCSNTFLLLLLPLAVSGLFLVAVLFALNLTVTEGGINGMIFYANVIGMLNTVLFLEETSHLYPFVAWLNLDLGISVCLYDGMDSYGETWLQFIFPVYLWAIIFVIIWFYRRFPSLANRLGGENAVKVLATLLLLSYTKLQRAVVTILSFTRLEYPSGVIRYVWLSDANVDFLKGKHLYLGIAGIFVLVFMIVPYTLCLTFFQQLQACSGRRLFKWVNKLKPVFDAYAGSYKDKYRFWTGMLLLVRTLLLVLFTLSSYAGSRAVEVNLLIVSVVSSVLLIAQSNGIYKKWHRNYLEAFFCAQLIVFAMGAVYVQHNQGSIVAVANVSFGLSVIAFLGVSGFSVVKRCTCACLKKHHLTNYANVEDDFPHSREFDSFT
jgi:predicted outer membrane repeat protein